jgi:peroxiredoxin 2/4
MADVFEFKSPVGLKAPEFSATIVTPSVEGKDPAFKDGVKLSDYKGKWLLLLFYPADFTFVCPTEILGVSDRYEEFKKAQVEVLGVSTDTKFSHLQWMKQAVKDGGLAGLKYPLVEDQGAAITRSFGVTTADGRKALRATFLIDPNGIVQHATVNALNVGRSVDETLRVAQAFQYAAQHNDEVCPMDWKPGAVTMKPNEGGKKEYFEKRKSA